MGLTLSLIIGSVPGAVLGARLSAVATPAWMRRFLAVVLLASALKLLHAPYSVLGAALAVLAAGWLAWLGASRLRRRWAPQPVPGEE
jgi:prolipoprotein diacylglyceryltransferase